MKPEAFPPLNEAQARHVRVTLATVEKLLAELRTHLQHPPQNLRLTRYEECFDPREAASLMPGVSEVEARVWRLADALALPAANESVRRSLVVGLELAAIGLEECRPEHGLRGYGDVPTETADYLEREIAVLEEAIHRLIARLQSPPCP